MTENSESTIGFDVAKRLLCIHFLRLVHAKPRYFFLELRPDSISSTWLIQLLRSGGVKGFNHTLKFTAVLRAASQRRRSTSRGEWPWPSDDHVHCTSCRMHCMHLPRRESNQWQRNGGAIDQFGVMLPRAHTLAVNYLIFCQ